MSLSVFKYQDYKLYLKAVIKENGQIRGYQTKLAAAAGCHRSYLSQLLRSKQHLNPEQGIRLASFWNLDATETSYLVELVNLARTDHKPLQNLIRKRLEELKRESENLAQRYSDASHMIGEHALLYYSSWHYGALHMLSGLDGRHSSEMMASRLQIPKLVADEALATLAKLGLVELRSGTWQTKPGHTHIPKDSPLCATNHNNWRQRAVLASQHPSRDGIHYTSAQSHAFLDFDRIKDVLLKTIDTTRAIVGPAKNEEATAICIDFFRL